MEVTLGRFASVVEIFHLECVCRLITVIDSEGGFGKAWRNAKALWVGGESGRTI